MHYMKFSSLFKTILKSSRHASVLKSMENSNPFIVPENYFEQFEKNILLQIKHIQPSTYIQPITLPIFKIIYPYIVVATISFILSLVIFETTFISSKFFIKSETLVLFQINNDLNSSKPFSFRPSDENNIFIIELNPSYAPQWIANSHFLYHPFAKEALDFCQKYNDYIASTGKQKPLTYTHFKSINDLQPTKPISTTPNLIKHLSDQTLSKEPTVSFTQSQSNSFINQESDISSKLPHFALPEEICSEMPFELKPSTLLQANRYKFQWSTGDNGYSIFVKESGTYSLTISQIDDPKNFTTHTTRVTIIPKPERTLQSHSILCSGQTLEISPQIENEYLYKYFWLPTYDTTKNIIINRPGLYVLAITACQTYFDTVLVTKEHCNIFIPNTITPNNDGINDLFYISGLEHHKNTQLTIYNRMGNIVYHSRDYQNNWKPENVDAGIYFYILRFADGVEMHGNLTILK